MKTRAAGLLLHPTSLPGRFGIGDLGPESDAFLDWAASAGQSVWQVLPLGPTGFGNSPYGTLSAFAGNPMLLSPDLLVHEGLLPASALAGLPGFPDHRVDFERVIAFKEGLLREAWRRFRGGGPSELRAELQGFGEAPAQRYWLSDWALFMALKERFGGAAFREWPEEFRCRRPAALARAERELADGISWHVFLQFLFFRQWDRVREAAHARGIRILGDVPIYVSPDSADVWSHPEIFELDEAGDPLRVAGGAPANVSATGSRAFRPTTSARRGSSGETPSSAGTFSSRTAFAGGSSACGRTCASRSSCASITSAASPATGRCRPGRRRRSREGGSRARAGSCSTLSRRRSATWTSWPRTSARSRPT
jgi:4-alpha-glucanotransferase